MDLFQKMLPIVLIGMAIMTVGNVLVEAPGKTILSSLSEGFFWAVAFLILFSAEILVIGAL